MEDPTTESTVRNEEGQMCPDFPTNPPGYGWQPSLLYNQHFGLPPFLDFRDLSWMESIFRKLQTSSWMGYTHPTGFGPKIHRELSGGVSEVSFQQSRWAVSLDVNHFAPSEIVVRTQSGFLEIEGKHEERQDDHGFISRCFLRKYKLPAGIRADGIRSVLTGDGVLTVEATLPDFEPPANVTVQVESQAVPSEDQKQDDCQPGQPKSADVAVPPTAEKPEGDAVGADERIHGTDDGLAGPSESSERGEDGILKQKDGEREEGEHVEEVDLAGVKDEVLESKPEAPKAPETPEAPKTSEAPEAPETSEAPEASETPEAPKVPETPEAPGAPETPKAPEAPEATETPKALEAPEATETHKAPEAPEATEAPEVPETPEAPETPKAPEAPEATETHKASKAPEAPEASDTVKPEKELDIQQKEEGETIQEVKVEGDLPSAGAEAEPLVPAGTLEEIPVKAMATRAVEQMEHIK